MTLDYDEFGLLAENAAEVDLPFTGPPAVRRVAVEVGDGRSVSAVVWGAPDTTAELVLLHGGAQNAHTWDTVALALNRPLVAVDLPGHGHSDWRADHDYSPAADADDVAVAVRALAPDAAMIVGMSLGGLTALSLAERHPDLVRKLVVVDVTPGTDRAKAEPVIAFISGQEQFGSFDEILDRTVRYSPTRAVSALRRGVRHNARELPDGSWTWRWDPHRPWRADAHGDLDLAYLWAAVDATAAPMLLVRGALSTVVADEDVEELLRRKPSARIAVVEGAGHSVQGDRPVELAALLADFLASAA